MFKIICENQKSYSEQNTLEVPNLASDANEWNIIRKLPSLLKIFHKTTVTLSEGSSTASNIVIYMAFVHVILSPKNFKYEGLSRLVNLVTSFKVSMNTRFLSKRPSVALRVPLRPRGHWSHLTHSPRTSCVSGCGVTSLGGSQSCVGGGCWGQLRQCPDRPSPIRTTWPGSGRKKRSSSVVSRRVLLSS